MSEYAKGGCIPSRKENDDSIPVVLSDGYFYFTWDDLDKEKFRELLDKINEGDYHGSDS